MYDVKDLASFGEYLLSDERKENIDKLQKFDNVELDLQKVHIEDLEAWNTIKDL